MFAHGGLSARGESAAAAESGVEGDVVGSRSEPPSSSYGNRSLGVGAGMPPSPPPDALLQRPLLCTASCSAAGV